MIHILVVPIFPAFYRIYLLLKFNPLQTFSFVTFSFFLKKMLHLNRNFKPSFFETPCERMEHFCVVSMKLLWVQTNRTLFTQSI